MNYQTKKIVKWIVIGTILGGLTLITFFAWFCAMFIAGGPAKTSKNIKDYPQIYEVRLNSGLIVFPDEITEEMLDTDFAFYYQDTWDSPTVCIYLQADYTPEAYRAEVERLENTQKIYGGTKRTLLRDEEGKYPYPAYIAVDNHHSEYEYALLTGENQITYIYTAYFDSDKVWFDQCYLPEDYGAKQEDIFYDGYSIYIKRVDTAYGMIDYDETKDEVVTVTDGHSRWIEDSIFTVRVQLDEQNREIITECEFSYYEPPIDRSNVFTYDEESDDTIFTDLVGYEFVDLRLNEERTTAIVTYVDHGEQKEWEMELTQYMKVKNEG